MKVYTYAEARENLASILDEARRLGAVRIRGQEGESFVLSPEGRPTSPLDVPGIDLGLTTAEIVGFVREGRRAADLTGASDAQPE